ncbi:MAG TPA: ParA family protein [Cyclobacteriaceae bacterium]
MVISIVNHKGGTGKTTTTLNLGSALALQGYRVLLVDFDAQGSLSYSLGIDDNEPTITDLFHGDENANNVIQQREGMDILPANATLADIELAIAKSESRYHHLKDLLNTLSVYDFVLIDCPPSLSLLTLNALTASAYIVVPMQMDVLALRGLDSMLETMQKVQPINPQLSLLGVLPIMVDPRKNIYKEIVSHIKSNYQDVRLFQHSIHTSVKAAEAPSFGKSVVTYAPTSTTANDYKKLAKEIVKQCKANKNK